MPCINLCVWRGGGGGEACLCMCMLMCVSCVFRHVSMILGADVGGCGCY